MRHYVVTIPDLTGTIRSLGLRAAKQCLPPAPDVIAGLGEAFRRVAAELGLTITRWSEALDDPGTYPRRIRELRALLEAGERPRVMLAYPSLINCLDGTEAGRPECIWALDSNGDSIQGFFCLFRNGRQV